MKREKKGKLKKPVKLFFILLFLCAGAFLYKKNEGFIKANVRHLLMLANSFGNEKREHKRKAEETNAELKNYHGSSIYVYDLTEGKEIKSLNAKERVPQASLVKIMTVYTALQEIKDLSEKAPVDKESYQRLVSENASMAGFYGNEETTYRDLLYGAMLPSGGECAESLAIRTAGSKQAFVKKMNEKAKALGMKDTKYTDVTGLDKEGYSSAKDIGRLLAECLKDGNFSAIFTKKRFQSTKTGSHPEGITMHSTVFRMLENYEEDGFRILGGKSGTTMEAGLCLATLSEKNGKRYVIVVMGVPFDDIRDTGEGQIKDTLKILREL